MMEEQYIPYLRIAGRLGIAPGENIYLVSDISRLMLAAIRHQEVFNPALFIDSFVNEIPGAHLFIPGFVNTLREGEVIDMKTLQPETGGLSKTAFSLYKKGIGARSNDPFHSFFIRGQQAEKIAGDRIDNTDTFGKNSVFAYLAGNPGKIVLVDLALYYGLTFAHFVEQEMQVTYRRKEIFNFDFTGTDGKRGMKKFEIYAKKKGYIPALNSLQPILIEQGVMKKYTMNGVVFSVIDIPGAYRIMAEDIKNNKAANLIRFKLSLYLKQLLKQFTR